MSLTVIQGDCREALTTLPDESVHCVVTSPPYWRLRDYGVPGQFGLEPTPQEYVENLVAVFREVRRVLREDGTLWLVLGDSYAGSGKGPSNEGSKQRTNKGSLIPGKRNQHGLKPKDLVGIPWMTAFALRDDGWYLRQWIPWVKKNAMVESVDDRPTAACEIVFLLSKSARCYYDHEAVKLPASMSFMNDGRWVTGSTDRNEKTGYAEAKAQNPKQPHRMFDKQRGHSRRHAGFTERWDAMEKKGQLSGWRSTRNSDWFFEGLLTDQNGDPLAFTVNTVPFPEAHFATYPPKLVEPCILAGCPVDGVVLDPFAGSGTTGLVADRLGRNAILIELNADYCRIAERRIKGDAPLLADVFLEIPGWPTSDNSRNRQIEQAYEKPGTERSGSVRSSRASCTSGG